MIPIDHNESPWACDHGNAIHAFEASYDIDQLIAANIIEEAKANEKDEEQKDNALGPLSSSRRMYKALMPRLMEQVPR